MKKWIIVLGVLLVLVMVAPFGLLVAFDRVVLLPNEAKLKNQALVFQAQHLADQEVLKTMESGFSLGTSKNAGVVLNRAICWKGADGKNENDCPLQLPPYLEEIFSEDKGENPESLSWLKRLQQTDLRRVDLTWMDRLKNYDHWEVDSSDVISQVVAQRKSYLNWPVPTFTLLTRWATVALAKGVQEQQIDMGISRAHHLAALSYSTEYYLGGMAAAAILFTINATLDKLNHPRMRYSTDEMRRALLESQAYLNLHNFTKYENTRKLGKFGQCANLKEYLSIIFQVYPLYLAAYLKEMQAMDEFVRMHTPHCRLPVFRQLWTTVRETHDFTSIIEKPYVISGLGIANLFPFSLYFSRRGRVINSIVNQNRFSMRGGQ